MAKTEKEAQIEREQSERIRLGQLAEEGLVSQFWLEIIKPVIDSMLRGINDLSSINLTSEKKASVEVAGRILGAKYLSEIETLIRGFIIDANTTLNSIEKRKKAEPLYRTVE